MYTLREKPENEYLSDSGLVLVNRYVELKSKKKLFNDEVDVELKKVEDALASFAEKESVDVVFGEKNKVRIKEFDQVKYPSKNSKERLELEKLLKEKGVWSDVNQLDTSALNKLIADCKLDDSLKTEIAKYITNEKSKRFYVSKN